MPIYAATTAEVNVLKAKTGDTKTALESRRVLWQGLPRETREKWKASCPDPILAEAWKTYVWLKEFFGE